MRTEQEIRERIVKLEEDIRWYDDYMNNTEKVLHEIEINVYMRRQREIREVINGLKWVLGEGK